MLSKLRNRQKGFTLIELLIVVAIIGIIAAILIPNFLDALHKGRSKRTMGDMRQLGLGLTEFWTDNGGAAAAGASPTVALSTWAGTDGIDEVEAALVPDYISQMVKTDGWGNDLIVQVQIANPPRTGYAIFVSPGRDDSAGTSWTVGSFHPTDYDQDIVWGDGSFFRAPSGVAAS